MEAASRRDFLRTAGLSAAAAGAAAVALPRLSALDSGSKTTSAAPAQEPAKLEGPLVAYLRDADSGQFSLLVGEREVHFTDRALAARLTNAAR